MVDVICVDLSPTEIWLFPGISDPLPSCFVAVSTDTMNSCSPIVIVDSSGTFWVVSPEQSVWYRCFGLLPQQVRILGPCNLWKLLFGGCIPTEIHHSL